MKVISLLAATIAVVSAIPPAESKYPKQWGSPPMFGTMDYRAFPGGYGHGSGTEARWIQEHMGQEKKENNGRISFPPAFGEPPAMQMRDFRPLPFGYGFGSSTIATWLEQKALELYGETVEEYNSEYAVESEGNRRKLTAGAGTPVNVTDPEVVAAARAGMEFVVREKQTNGENALLMILSVRRGTQQIVAGVKYSLVVAVSDGQDHYIEVLDQAWRTPRYALLAHVADAKVVRQLQMLGEGGHGIWRGNQVSKYPKQWGSPPMIGTMDYRAFPGGYGHGSGTEARWIQEHMDQEKKENNGRISFPPAFGEPPAIQTDDLRPLPFGYGMGSGTIATWLEQKALELYGETVEEYNAEVSGNGNGPQRK